MFCQNVAGFFYFHKNDYKGMEVKCKANDTLPLSELIEFQGNLKERTDADFEKITKSIKKHGFAFPFFVWKHDGINHVLDGHGRIGALKRMVAQGEHLPLLPVVYVNAKDEADAKELLLKLNSHYGQMTAESVRDFLGDLQIDFEDLALPEIDQTEIDSKAGEIYELGPHRLMCGDSTNKEDIEKLMNGAKADLIATDPPYNVNYGEKQKVFNKVCPSKGGRLEADIANDCLGNKAFLSFLTAAFSAMFTALKAGGVYYIWHADSEGFNFRQTVKNCNGTVCQCLIWVKNSLVIGRQDYQLRHEPCLYGWKEGGGHYWEGRHDLSKVIDERPNYKKMDKESLLKEVEKLRGENIPSTVIYEDKPARNDDYPTMKSVKLFERLIKNSSKQEDSVLDPFGGSGTTLIACEKTNRIARTMEIDPHYCDVIRRRWTKWAKANGVKVGSGGLE